MSAVRSPGRPRPSRPGSRSTPTRSLRSPRRRESAGGALDHMPEGERTGRVLHSLTDMNGDGVTDLVVFSLKGSSLWKMHSSYEVHFGVGGARRRHGVLAGGRRRRGVPGHHRRRRPARLRRRRPGRRRADHLRPDCLQRRARPHHVDLHRRWIVRPRVLPHGGRPLRAPPGAVREIRPRSPRKTGERTFWPAILLGDVNGDGRSGRGDRQEPQGAPCSPRRTRTGPVREEARRIATPVPEDEGVHLAGGPERGRHPGRADAPRVRARGAARNGTDVSLGYSWNRRVTLTIRARLLSPGKPCVSVSRCSL